MIKSLKTEAYERISKELLDGNINPGDPLDEVDLKIKIGIGRTPIREAIMLLEQEGIVKVYPRRGVFVSKLTLKDIKEVFEIREALEGMAAKLATKNARKKDLEEFEKRFMEANNLKDEKKRQCSYEKVADDFHDYVLSNSKNIRIQKAVKSYRTVLKIGQQMAVRIPGRVEKSFKEHIEILNAIKNGDEKEAEKMMRRHIISTYDSIITS